MDGWYLLSHLFCFTTKAKLFLLHIYLTFTVVLNTPVNGASPVPLGRLGSLQNTFHWQDFFLVFSLSFPFLTASYNLPWLSCMCQSPHFSTQDREAVHIKDWYINVFKRVKSAYTEGLRQNSIYSPPRECQDSEVSDFSGMAYNYCSVTQHFCRWRQTQFQDTNPPASIWKQQQLISRPEALRGHSSSQPPALLFVEGGAGEAAETEQSWMEPPCHQPALSHHRLTTEPGSHFPRVLRQVQSHTSSPALLPGCLKLSRQHFSVPLLVSIVTCQQPSNLECC